MLLGTHYTWGYLDWCVIPKISYLGATTSSSTASKQWQQARSKQFCLHVSDPCVSDGTMSVADPIHESSSLGYMHLSWELSLKKVPT